MRNIKKIMRPIHKWGALISGVVLFVICISGAILTFEQEITPYITSGYFTKQPQKAPVNVEQLYHQIGIHFPNQAIATLSIPANGQRNAIVVFEKDPSTQYYVNPITGQQEGVFVYNDSFFGVVRQLHRFLLMGPNGRIIVGSCSIIFALLLLSGILVRLPSGWQRLPSIFRFSKGGNAFRKIYDWHSVPGVFALIFLLIMSLSGPYWSFSWYNQMISNLFGLKPTTSQHGKPQNSTPEKSTQKQLTAEQFLQIERSMQTVAISNPTSPWSELRIIFPTGKGTTYSIASVPKHRIHGRQIDQYTFSLADGKLVQESVFRNNSWKQSFRMWIFAVHTGSWGGIFTKIIYAICVLIGASLPVTGYLMWWKKRKKSNPRKY